MKEYLIEFLDGSSTVLIVGPDETVQEALLSHCRAYGLHLGHVTAVIPVNEEAVNSLTPRKPDSKTNSY